MRLAEEKTLCCPLEEITSEVENADYFLVIIALPAMAHCAYFDCVVGEHTTALPLRFGIATAFGAFYEVQQWNHYIKFRTMHAALLNVRPGLPDGLSRGVQGTAPRSPSSSPKRTPLLWMRPLPWEQGSRAAYAIE